MVKRQKKQENTIAEYHQPKKSKQSRKWLIPELASNREDLNLALAKRSKVESDI